MKEERGWSPVWLAIRSIATHSLGLLTYWVIWFAAVNLFVIGYEEPTLRRQFGASYERYSQTVHRWIPTFRSRASSG